MATIFTKIINGEIPAYKIAEDDNYLAFLDMSSPIGSHSVNTGHLRAKIMEKVLPVGVELA